MKRLFFILCFYGFFTEGYTNDGAFYMAGNQLVPINETDISVKKEILYIKKTEEFAEVSVYYEFFNPKDEKEIIVGFEAGIPLGDAGFSPVNGHHPYMFDFTVSLNGNFLPYQIAFVKNSTYTKNHKIQNIDPKSLDNDVIGDELDFQYVYHFKAKFKKGKNIVKHTYRYKLSRGVCYYYDFNYVLTAANRWANKQIDDFTLILDMGDFQTASIRKTFFKNTNEWTFNGIGKITENPDYTNFYIQQGILVFEKKNFVPKGELYVEEESSYCREAGSNQKFIFSLGKNRELGDPTEKTPEEKRIIRNLPFARRGYIFKDKTLQDVFKTEDWYQPNPSYVPEVEALTEEEKQLIKTFK
nr:YARHG domain-containing protein [uncultured Capnocytophaga sp.]